LLKLRGGDFSQRYHFSIANNNSRIKRSSTGSPDARSGLLGIRFAQQPAAWIERMPRETHSTGRIRLASRQASATAPQTIVAVGSEKPSGQTLGLLVRRGLMPATILTAILTALLGCIRRRDSTAQCLRVCRSSMRSEHRDSAEMTAAVTESFANDYEPHASQALLHVSA
jgi:hypothetical protein